MNDPRSQSTGAASGIEARVERIRQGMAAQQARLTRGSMITATVGAILCIAMAAWFYVGYKMAIEITTPSKLVQTAESLIVDSIPQARKALEREINESADEWAADISKQIQKDMPKVRQELEEFLVKKGSEAIDEFQVLSANEFRGFVQKNQSMLGDGFRSLKKPDEAERFIQDLHVAVETQLAADTREHAENLFHILIDLNSKLEALQKGERLNQEQALEREILMIAKRLQLETHLDQASGGPDSPLAKRRTQSTGPSDEPAPESGEPGAETEKAKDQPASSDGEPKANEAEKKEEPKKEEPAEKKDEPAKEKKEEPAKEAEKTESSEKKKDGDN